MSHGYETAGADPRAAGCPGFLSITHPQTAFAADGLDPDWDAAVNNRDTTRQTVLFFAATRCSYCRNSPTVRWRDPKLKRI
jgi:hypothetical protein